MLKYTGGGPQQSNLKTRRTIPTLVMTPLIRESLPRDPNHRPPKAKDSSVDGALVRPDESLNASTGRLDAPKQCDPKCCSQRSHWLHWSSGIGSQPTFMDRHALSVHFQLGPQRRLVSHGEEKCGNGDSDRHRDADEPHGKEPFIRIEGDGKERQK